MASAVMTRASAFSYACGRCSRCCRDKGIMLNPYEVLRLARNQGLTTTDFIARFTERSGTKLKQRDDGSCVFLGATGCQVHADRPLVCRIYPLARHVSPEDEETFSELEPHPQTEGRYGTEGTVGDYLEAQGAAPFVQAVDRYLNLFRELADSLAEQELAVPEDDAAPGPDGLDMDLVVDEYCGERGLPKPTDASRLMELHVQALKSWWSSFTEEESS